MVSKHPFSSAFPFISFACNTVIQAFTCSIPKLSLIPLPILPTHLSFSICLIHNHIIHDTYLGNLYVTLHPEIDLRDRCSVDFTEY